MILFKKTCEKCKTIKTVKRLKTSKEFFDKLEELKKLSASDDYECVGDNNPTDTIRHWPQDGLWHKIRCKKCGALYTVWYDTFRSKGSFKKGK